MHNINANTKKKFKKSWKPMILSMYNTINIKEKSWKLSISFKISGFFVVNTKEEINIEY